MKHIIKVLSLLFFLKIQFYKEIYAQIGIGAPKYGFHYKLTYIPDSISKIEKSAEFLLFINDSLSLFHDKEILNQDSVVSGVLFGSFSFQDAAASINKIPLPRFNYIIKKNRIHNIINFYEPLGLNGTIYYTELFNPLWEISEAKDTLFNYIIYKATCAYGGRKFEAWFTPDIPVSEGPYKFYGLPGLILKISDLRGDYKFELIRSISSDALTTGKYSRYFNPVKTTKNEFINIKNEYEKNPLAGFEQFPQVKVSEESRKKLIEKAELKLKLNNNPLELINFKVN